MPSNPVDTPLPRMARLTAALGTLALVVALGRVAPARGQAEPPPQLELGTYEGVPWPIIAAPVWPPPRRPASTTAPAPATEAGGRVLATLASVARSLRTTRYQHTTRVRESEGLYAWDCSGMAAWVLRRAAPAALRQITRPRPVARDFVSAIEHAPTGTPRGGWQRVERLEDALPGDVFAWRRPRGFPSRNTGHVGFVLQRPTRVPGLVGDGFTSAWAVLVADATSLPHQDDSRPEGSEGGYGTGTLVFFTDAEGRGSHYGWHGTASQGYVVTPIVVGRVSR